MYEEPETIHWPSRRKKACKYTKGDHEFKEYTHWFGMRDARCGCGKKLWVEFQCDTCKEWVDQPYNHCT